MGLLSIVCSCTALFVTGIRRLPGLEMDVDEFKFAVQKRKPNELVGLLSSLVQGSSHAKWSDIGDNISTIIDDLAKDVVSVLTSENTASQDQVYRETNEYNYWIKVRTSGEAQARDAEQALGEAVDAESVSATDFHNNHSAWTLQMKEVLAPCTTQENLMDVEIAVNPQSSFTCDLSQDTGDLNCDNSFAAYETNVTDEVSALNTSYLGKKSVYLMWQGYCIDNISDANTKFGATEQAFKEWRALRAIVDEKFQARKQTVCGNPAQCADGVLKGLNTIVSNECGSGKSIRDTKAKIGSDNTSQSLADRNYEVESLNVVHCLLDKLKSFNDDQWNDESVANIVDTCSGEGAPVKFASYDINFKTSSEDQSFEDTATTSCYAATSTTDESLTDLDAASIYDKSTVSDAKRPVKVDYEKGGETIYSQIGEGIPGTFVGSVNVPDPWTKKGDDASKCREYFCESSTDACFDQVKRTEMKCDEGSISGEVYRTLMSGHLVEFSGVQGQVPIAYAQGSADKRVFANNVLVGCQSR